MTMSDSWGQARAEGFRQEQGGCGCDSGCTQRDFLAGRWVIIVMYRLGGIFAVLGLLVGGCGDPGGPTANVEGTVSVDGEPVQQGMISFTPMQAGAGTAVTANVRNGRYEVRGVPMGRVLVQIHATKETGKMLVDEVEDGEYPETIDLVPQKYHSGIEITVAESKASHDFELTP